jgi:hypothetical protein
VGTLTGLSEPNGECVDKAGDVFVTQTGSASIVEYAHGATTPTTTLDDVSGNYPYACSVDPTTGNLAVSNFISSFGSGSLAIFTNAQGTPNIVTDATFQGMYSVAYDNAGNLYVDGTPSNGGASTSFVFAELPKGATSFTDITLNQQIGFPGGVAWDGKYVAVGNQDSPTVYEFSISGATGTSEGSTNLANLSTSVAQFWIQGERGPWSQLIGPSCGQNNTTLWAYHSGNSVKTLAGNGCPAGAVVSRVVTR